MARETKRPLATGEGSSTKSLGGARDTDQATAESVERKEAVACLMACSAHRCPMVCPTVREIMNRPAAVAL